MVRLNRLIPELIADWLHWWPWFRSTALVFICTVGTVIGLVIFLTFVINYHPAPVKAAPNCLVYLNAGDGELHEAFPSYTAATANYLRYQLCKEYGE